MKKFLNYTQWQNAADTLHMLLQITGKIKLERCYKQPEWSHIRQYLTIDGITTGIMPGDESPFEILVNLRKHYIRLRNATGKEIRIPLENEVSISEYYKQISQALKHIGSPTRIFVRPQEFYDSIDFDKDEKHASYDKYAVNLFLDNLHFAYLALKEFMSPFRGKVTYPAYYFGTMDLSGIIYSGESEPFETTDKISLHAFDERSCEFGFWPGDPIFHKPSFYVMPYPFISSIDHYGNILRPDQAVFKPEKKEFFLTLEDVFRHDQPTEAVIEFFKSSFTILQQLKKWNNFDWITHPLSYS